MNEWIVFINCFASVDRLIWVIGTVNGRTNESTIYGKVFERATLKLMQVLNAEEALTFGISPTGRHCLRGRFIHSFCVDIHLSLIHI